MKSKRLSIVLLTIGILILPAAARAQTGSIRGYVLDATTGSPIAGTTVNLLDGTGTPLGSSSVTSQQGFFFFPGLSIGTYGLQSILTGYTTVTVSEVQVLDGVISWIYIQMGSPITTRYVTNTYDSGAGSFRRALTDANGGTGTQTIRFDIHTDDPGYNATSGSFTIQPTATLPRITDPVVIDGYSQPGAAPATASSEAVLMIHLDGFQNVSMPSDGLYVTSGGSVIRGLAITRFTSAGIKLWHGGGNRVEGCYLGIDTDGQTASGNGTALSIGFESNANVIGGSTPDKRNVISGNTSGVQIGSEYNEIEGNYIGTDASGMSGIGNSSSGIHISRSYNTIGGTEPGAGNLISGNPKGVYVQNASGNRFEGNLIGTDKTGLVSLVEDSNLGIQIRPGTNNVIGGLTASARNVISGHQTGIHIEGSGNQVLGNYIGTDLSGMVAVENWNSGITLFQATDNIIGGTDPGAGNLISGNGTGITMLGLVAGSKSTGNVVQGNLIGTDWTGSGQLANSVGVWLYIEADDNTIGGTADDAGNVIAFNLESGVIVETGTGNAIYGNSIHSNGALGIDLKNDGVTANDEDDPDNGGYNELQNYPDLGMAVRGLDDLAIAGSLNSTPGTTYRLEFFANSVADLITGFGEGEIYLGTTNVTTDGSGDTEFSVTVPYTGSEGNFISATATDPDGNTSEFSESVSMSYVITSQSAFFNGPGAGSRIRVLDENRINLSAIPSAYQITGTKISVEAWVYPLGFPDPQLGSHIVGRPISPNEDPWSISSLWVYHGEQGEDPKPGFTISTGERGSGIAAISPDELQTFQWTHLAGTYDGAFLRLYVNGELKDQVETNIVIGGQGVGFYIGRYLSNRFFGLIDDVRLWNVARSQTEILNNLNIELTGNEAGLAGYWKLEDSVNIDGVLGTVDETSNHNDLVVQGSLTSFVPYNPFAVYGVPSISGFPASLDFGTIEQAERATRTFTLSNTSAYPLIGKGVVEESGFTSEVNGFFIAPGATENVHTSVRAIDTGFLAGTLNLQSNAASPVTVPFSLSSFAVRRFDVNNIAMWMQRDGRFAREPFPQTSSDAGFEWPKGSGKTAIYTSGIWVGATVGGEVRTAVSEYNSEFAPGPAVGGVPVDPNNTKYRVYKIQTGDDAGNNLDFAYWPADMGAPVNSDGTPKILGDQTLFAVYNDLDPSRHHFGTSPLGVEVQQTTFGFNQSGALGDAVFLRFKVINRSNDTWDNAFVALWSDPDLGDHLNDLVGIDVSRNLGYDYSGTDTDGVYGTPPPAVGFDILQGALPAQPIQVFSYYTGLSAAYPFSDPGNGIEAYNFMRGLGADGTPYIDPMSGVTTFPLSGDPVSDTGWVDSEPADRRFLFSTGPFDLEPGESKELIAAIIVGQGADRLSSITALRSASDEIQALFDGGEILDGAAPPINAPPSIAVYQPTGVQSGNVTIPYVISDADDEDVDLSAEYSDTQGSGWHPATVTGATSGIDRDNYAGSLIWNSRADLQDIDAGYIWFRITPSDAVGPGTADFTLIDLDNQSPRSMSAEGITDESSLSFWFNEPVAIDFFTDPANITLSGGLEIESISVEDNWDEGKEIPYTVNGAGAAEIEGKLYVAGGHSGTYLTSLAVYDPADDDWTPLTSMDFPRKDAAVASIDGKLYVAGGYNGSRLDVLEVYDPISGQWLTKEHMLTARDGEAAVLDGKLYVVGGHDGSDYVGTLEVYDPATNVWLPKDPMNEARWQHVAQVIDGKLYVTGGRNGTGYLSSIEVYDPDSGNWSTLPSLMPTPRYYSLSGVIGGKLYVVGGYDGDPQVRLDVLEIYDPLNSNDPWTTGKSMTTARNSLAGGVINGKLYAVGGVDGTTSYLDDLEIYDPQVMFTAQLVPEQYLPAATSVTIATSNISDYYSNTSAGLFKATFETAASFLTVTHTGDSDQGSPDYPGSLRWAIENANKNSGKDLIKFNIPGTGPFTIQPVTPLPNITDPVIIDGFTQPGSSPNTNGAWLGSNAVLKIVLDGSSIVGLANGLTFMAGNNTVRGLVIHSFNGGGVSLEAGEGSVIEGNYIGTDVTGTGDLVGNSDMGIYIGTSSGNTIGGTAYKARNVISGNNGFGVLIDEVGAGGNSVLGNFIGIDATGDSELGNESSGVAVFAPDNVIGGASPESRNIISANASGISIERVTATGNKVLGNYIGTDVTGSSHKGNGLYGIVVNGATLNTIGGATADQRNIISGGQIGIMLQNSADTNTIFGNFIGTDVSGTEITDSKGGSLGNSAGGISIDASQKNVIGGIGENEGNLISGNGEGILIRDSSQSRPSDRNIIKGNKIGTDVTGVENLGNTGNGIRLGSGNSSYNVIGGQETGAGNIIVFNGGSGIAIETGTGNAIFSNTIHSNVGLGIDLDDPAGDPINPNDNGLDPDGDTGPNNLQNYPDLISASYGPGSITISGSLLSTSESTFTLQYFANTEADPSGYGEGETYLGAAQVTTDEEGLAGFSHTFLVSGHPGLFITATATAADNSTSEFSFAVQTAVLKVTTTEDVDEEGKPVAGSLRQAIINANTGDEGTIVFEIPEDDLGYQNGVWTIQPVTPLPIITSPVTIDGYTQAGASPNTNLIADGSNAVLKIVLDGSVQSGASGVLTLDSGKSVIRGLVINGAQNGAGIHIGGGLGENIIEGCYIGTDASGMLAVPNGDDGIRIYNSAANLIGGDTPAARNVISGNGDMGVEIFGDDSDANFLKGNYIGVDASGSAGLGNYYHGVLITEGADNNVIGGSEESERNIISGNGLAPDGGIGVEIIIQGTTENYVEGNYIGTDARGEKSIPNTTDGVSINNSSGNKVGGEKPGTGNLISGNGLHGISILNAYATDNMVQGNLIGTNAAGSDTLASDQANGVDNGSNAGNGVFILDAPHNIIGGTNEAARNIISGNWLNGVWVEGAEATGNLIQGSYIGTDVDGNYSIFNGNNEPAPINPPQAGVVIWDAPGNTIGGTTNGAGNLISGNMVRGISIWGAGSTANKIQGNNIGLNAAGDAAVGNVLGISVGGGASYNMIGGTVAGAGNIVSGNTARGINLFDDTTDNNVIQGNWVGLNAAGTDVIGNGNWGIRISRGDNNIIGGTEPGAGNVVSGNASGIMITTDANDNVIKGNLIGTDPSGTRALGNNVGNGIRTFAAADENGFIAEPPMNTVIGGLEPGAGNLVANNAGNGIRISGGSGHTIQGNSIFANGGLGIDLSLPGEAGQILTPNDDLDADEGTNGLQNYPILTSVNYGPESVTIAGTLNSVKNKNFTLEFFANPSADPSGFGEGKTPLGTHEVGTNNDGDVAFEVTFPADGTEGVFITATATDEDGNTSEFSARASTPVYTVTTTEDTGTEGSLRYAIVEANTTDGTDTIVFNILEDSNTGVFTMTLYDALPDIETPMIIDGTTQPGYAGMPLIVLEGGGPQGSMAVGLQITGSNVVVRGLVIGGFNSAGIVIDGSVTGAAANVIEGNFIGTDVTGTEADGNGVGIRIIGSPDNRIGGAVWPNIIAGNTSHGIHISGAASTGNRIEANFIGTNPEAAEGLGNGEDGVRISFEGNGVPVGNSVGGYETGAEGNVIAYNSGNGVAILAGTQNSVLSNYIYSNGEMGITFTGENIPIDPEDTVPLDAPNNYQSAPEITFAQTYPHYVEGIIDSEPGTTYRIEFFVNLESDPSGSGEGEYFIGSTDVTTFESGQASFTGSFHGPLSNSLFITATATDPDGNTSEFSEPYSTTAQSKSYGYHYVLNMTYSGIPLHWEKGTSTFTVSESVPPAYRQAVVNGYRTWDELGQLNYTQTDPTLSTQWGGDVDGINNNVWIESDWNETTGTSEGTIALARVRYNALTGVMTDVDIAINAQHQQWAIDPQAGSNELDLQNMITHEAGHYSGLGDIYEEGDPGYVSGMGSGNTEQTMYGLIKLEEIKKKDLNLGDELGIEAIYGFLSKTGISLVLVFDGSDLYASATDGYDAFVDAQNAASELVNKLRVGDRIGVVLLDGDTPIEVVPITQITDSESRRESIKSDIERMTPTGGTVIPLGAGVEKAQMQLMSVPGTYTSRQAMILFATGAETIEPYTETTILPDISGTDTEIYTIGFADNTDHNTLLSNLSDETGGKYYMAIDAAEIGDKVNRIWEQLIGWQILYQETFSTEELENVPYPGVRWQGAVGVRWQGGVGVRWQGADGVRWQGGTGVRWQGGWGVRWQGADGVRWQGGTGVRWQGGTGVRWQGAVVDGSITTIEPGVRWQGSDLDLTVQDPTGRMITPEVAAEDDMIEYVSGDTYEYYRITNPMPGEWTLWIYGVDLPEEPEPYTVYMAIHTDLTMNVTFDKEQYEVGENMLISLKLLKGGEPQGDIDVTGGEPITDASVYALINRPGSEELEGIELMHRGNGEYTAVFTATEETGDYRFFFGAEKVTPDGNSLEFFRWTEHAVYVAVAYGSGLSPIRSTIMLAPDNAFKSPATNRKNAFSNKLDEVENKLKEHDYRGAINKLRNDILKKMDGSNEGNKKDDWIIETTLQGRLYDLITAFIESIQGAGAGSPVLQGPVEQEASVRFEMSQNFPNPFNMETQIRYSLPESRRVMLRIYDIRGRLVRTLVDAEKTAGAHTIRWDGRNSYGRVVSSGIYIYRLQAGEDVVTKKMTILK